MIKKCIWCSKDGQHTSFKNLAHTIPQSLGGKNTCDSVCDSCNSYFGNRTTTQPAVELVFKETFAFARHRFLSPSEHTKSKKQAPRYKSIYFDLKNNKVKLKSQFKFNRNFQTTVCRQLKKGIFKVYLEEIERQQKRGHDNQYDFMREFCRFDMGDYPIIYFERLHGIYPMATGWVENPTLILDPDYKFKYLIESLGLFEFELLGHTFGIPTIRNWELAFKLYIEQSSKAKEEYFRSWRELRQFSDIDLLLNILDT
jgi:hypothetical protein